MPLSTAIMTLVMMATSVKAQSKLCTPLLAAVNADPSLTSLAEKLAGADWLAKVNSSAPYTLFAPTDSAFSAPAVVRLLAAMPPENLQSILTLHVAVGPFSGATLKKSDGQTLPTINGQLLEVSVENSTVFVAEAESEGVAEVVQADAKTDLCGGSRIHHIDALLLPQESPSSAPSAACSLAMDVMRALDLGMAANVVKAYGMEDLYNSLTPHTIFVPPDSALVVTDANIATPPEVVKTIFTAHVVPGLYRANILRTMKSLTTVNNYTINVGVDPTKGNIVLSNEYHSATIIQANAAQTVTSNVCNGTVIHVISNPLSPLSDAPPPPPGELLGGSCTPLYTVMQTYDDLSIAVAYVSNSTSAREYVTSATGRGYTILTPTNDASFAFQKNPISVVLKGGVILGTLIIDGVLLSSNLTDGKQIVTLGKSTLTVSNKDNVITIIGPTGDQAQIVQADIGGPGKGICGNSVTHVINQVLLPGPGAVEIADITIPQPEPVVDNTPEQQKNEANLHRLTAGLLTAASLLTSLMVW